MVCVLTRFSLRDPRLDPVCAPRVAGRVISVVHGSIPFGARWICDLSFADLAQPHPFVVGVFETIVVNMKRAGAGINDSRLPPIAFRLHFHALAYLRVHLAFGPGQYRARSKASRSSKRRPLFFGEGHVLFDVLSEFAQSYLSIAVEIGKGFPGETCDQHLSEGTVSRREFTCRGRS